MDEPLPRAGIFWLFVGLPLAISTLLIILLTFADRYLGEPNRSSSVIMISISVFMLANGLRAILSCVDWFEARMAKKAAEHG
jgi:hypothetical protein